MRRRGGTQSRRAPGHPVQRVASLHPSRRPGSSYARGRAAPAKRVGEVGGPVPPRLRSLDRDLLRASRHEARLKGGLPPRCSLLVIGRTRNRTGPFGHRGGGARRRTCSACRGEHCPVRFEPKSTGLRWLAGGQCPALDGCREPLRVRGAHLGKLSRDTMVVGKDRLQSTANALAAGGFDDSDPFLDGHAVDELLAGRGVDLPGGVSCADPLQSRSRRWRCRQGQAARPSSRQIPRSECVHTGELWD
jgi:hypothetical protein